MDLLRHSELSGEKTFIKTGRMRRATFAQVCKCILSGAECKTPLLATAFDRLDCCAMKTTTQAQVQICLETKVTLRATEKVCDAAFLMLFNSDTEGDVFSGFSAQEEDEDNGQLFFW